VILFFAVQLAGCMCFIFIEVLWTGVSYGIY